jgi:amino acid transporter
MSIALLTLALVGTLALLGSILDGYRMGGDPGAVRGHFLLALAATFLLVMAHCFIMFFLIATGVELKALEKERGWGDTFRRRTVALKARVFPAMTLALALVVANFVLGAAAHTRALPTIVHGALAWLTFAACVFALCREYQTLGENNRLIAEAGEKRRVPSSAA